MQSVCLYRYFDNDNNLLYVGITQNQLNRSQQHNSTSVWFSQVKYATFEHYATRQEALDAEKAAIISELPKWNRLHNPTSETWRSHWTRLFDLSSDLKNQDTWHEQLIRSFNDFQWPKMPRQNLT